MTTVQRILHTRSNSIFLLGLFVLTLASACNSGETSTATDSNGPPPPPAPAFVGYFEADAGSENLPGPLLSLTLMEDRGAELITDSMNYKPESVEIGEWVSDEGGKIDVTLTPMDFSAERTIHLELIGENLLWTGEGNEVVFQPADQVAGRIRELIMWVAPDQVDCGEGKKCFQVSFGDTQSPGPLQRFYDPIAGFLWHPGIAYKIKVKETYKGDNSLEASSVKYELVEILLQKSIE